MLYYNRNDINKGKDPIKSNKQVIKLKITWLCSSCHGLTILCLNISDIAISTVKNVDYCCIIDNISTL